MCDIVNMNVSPTCILYIDMKRTNFSSKQIYLSLFKNSYFILYYIPIDLRPLALTYYM